MASASSAARRVPASGAPGALPALATTSRTSSSLLGFCEAKSSISGTWTPLAPAMVGGMHRLLPWSGRHAS